MSKDQIIFGLRYLVWMFVMYFIRIGDAMSQLINVVFFWSMNPNESISGRAYRLSEDPLWGALRVAIDFIASPLEEDHCQKAWAADIERAQKMIEQSGA